MRCELCGQEYGVAHNCAEVPPAPPLSDIQPPEDFALWHYLKEAYRIATWDDDAIHRTMNDPRAILYGAIVYTLSVGVQLLVPVTKFMLGGQFEFSIIVGSSLAVVVLSAVFSDLVRISICHFLAKRFAGGTGKFTQLLGPFLLGSIVYLAALIPGPGAFYAGIGSIAVFAKTFQEVHGIKPLTAILFSAGVGMVFLIAQISLLPPLPKP
jgi:hypothetical protein